MRVESIQRRLTRFLASALVCATAMVSRAHADKPAVEADSDHAARMARGLEIFKQHVRPLLVQRCFRCHGGKSIEAEFSLTDREELLRGGHSGPAIVPGHASQSLLYQLIAHVREPHMPHKGAKLPATAVAKIADWIESGAPYDKPLRRRETAAWTTKQVPASAREFWSFQPLRPSRRQKSKRLHGPERPWIGSSSPGWKPPASRLTRLRANGSSFAGFIST